MIVDASPAVAGIGVVTAMVLIYALIAKLGGSKHAFALGIGFLAFAAAAGGASFSSRRSRTTSVPAPSLSRPG